MRLRGRGQAARVCGEGPRLHPPARPAGLLPAAMGRAEQPGRGLLLPHRKGRGLQRDRQDGADGDALGGGPGLAGGRGDHAARQRRHGARRLARLHGVPRRRAVRPDGVSVPRRAAVGRALRQDGQGRPLAAPLGGVQGLWRHDPAAGVHGRRHRPQGQRRLHPAALGRDRRHGRGRNLAAAGRLRRAAGAPGRHGQHAQGAGQGKGPQTAEHVPRRLEVQAGQQQVGPLQGAHRHPAVPRHVGPHRGGDAHVCLLHRQLARLPARHRRDGLLGLRDPRHRVRGAVLPLQNHLRRPRFPPEGRAHRHGPPAEDRRRSGRRQHLQQPSAASGPLEPAVRDMQDRAAAARQALLRHRPVRGEL
mmetsp:Transcript_41408/g.105907  ORF Transcript_41408/g.105907 Transcript_41408/m.105907 type:complete len:361 (+) Transcript_41408:392-1474(+)